MTDPFDIDHWLDPNPMYRDMDGNPMSLWGFAEACDPANFTDQKWIARTHLTSGDQEWQVSTVNLFIDHGWGRSVPIHFETMVFGPFEVMDEYTQRYATKEAANEGHYNVVGALVGILDDPEVHYVTEAEERQRYAESTYKENIVE